MSDSTSKNLVVTTSGQMVAASGADTLLAAVRPSWQSKSLINRVKSLLPVDPSSACQRLLNAAIHDLREKIIIAGLDMAQEAASLNRLPPASKAEDIQEYSTTHTLDLAYHIGIINRPEWRRLKRAYDIRKDLEHEDDLYEAGVEDCVYVFRTCIEIVLSRDPVSPVRVVDVKEIIESPSAVVMSKELIDDFQSAPDRRQIEILKFLISTARDSRKPDIVRQNAIEALRATKEFTRKSSQAETGQFMQEMLKNKPIDLADMKIAAASGVSPYLKQSKAKQFFEELMSRFEVIGYSWGAYSQHEKLFDEFEDVGGFHAVPADVKEKFVFWMVRCYLGEPGGYGMGVNRPVFFSNVAAPRIEVAFKKAGSIIAEQLDVVSKERVVTVAITNKHIGRRFDKLKDIIGGSDD